MGKSRVGFLELAAASMRIHLYGLAFETPRVTFHLTSPWRAGHLEHRLFEAIRGLPGTQVEKDTDEWRIDVADVKTWRLAVQAMARVLKGWQEEAEPGSEHRRWSWLIDGDTNAYGYDQQGEKASLWAIIQVSLDRGGPQDPDKGEDIDLEGFSVRIWGVGAEDT